MKLSSILNHRDFDWKLRRQQPKVTEMFLAIVKQLTGLKPNTEKHSPVKKAANEFATRAKKMKGGSEVDFQAREKSWLESFEIELGDKETLDGDQQILDGDQQILDGSQDFVGGDEMFVDDGEKLVDGDEQIVQEDKSIVEEDINVDVEESIEEIRIQTLRKKLALAQEKSLKYEVKHKKIMMMKEAKVQSNFIKKVR